MNWVDFKREFVNWKIVSESSKNVVEQHKELKDMRERERVKRHGKE